MVRGGRARRAQGRQLPRRRAPRPAIDDEGPRATSNSALEQGVDYVALSFVRERGRHRRGCAPAPARAASRPLVIAKIEKPQAIENLEEILAAADGIMVARGDLGVEMPAEAVPIVQKRIIERANRCERLVITATQMLESMVDATRARRAPRPPTSRTRSSTARTPSCCAPRPRWGGIRTGPSRTMARIAAEADEFAAQRTRTPRRSRRERGSWSRRRTRSRTPPSRPSREIRARALVIFTHTGYSARLVTKSRPQAPIFALTPLESTCRRLSLAWGVSAGGRARAGERRKGWSEAGLRILIRKKLLRRGDWVVAMAGTTTRSGGTNMLRILQQGRPPDQPADSRSR